MVNSLQSLVVTGASGVVGRHFLAAARQHFRIYALARRSQRQAGVPSHDNITWIQVDIGNWPALKSVMQGIKDRGGADFILHLAAYYDFGNTNNPEYVRTNVNGTRHMLEQARWLCVRRFIFASSVAACTPPVPGSTITEASPLDASFPYAVSKRRGEELVTEYAQWVPSSVVRLAAVFSDWCEYPPLYVFLSTWLSRRWNAGILAGRGGSAVSYLHVDDLNRLLLTVLRRSRVLPSHGVYLASPDGATSHADLYEAATRYFWGRARRPLRVPRLVATPGVVARDLVGRLIGRRPFERLWMLAYVDRPFTVDACRTRAELGWEPSPRYHVLRRLLFLVERLRTEPETWHRCNQAILRRAVERPNLRLYEALLALRERLVGEIVDAVRSAEGRRVLPHYQRMDPAALEWSAGMFFRVLMAAVRTQDRSLLLQYAGDIAARRFGAGFGLDELRWVIELVERNLVSELRACPEARGLESEIHAGVTLSLQMVRDEIEACFEGLGEGAPAAADLTEGPRAAVPSRRELEAMIAHLEAFHWPSVGGGVDGDDASPKKPEA